MRQLLIGCLLVLVLLTSVGCRPASTPTLIPTPTPDMDAWEEYSKAWHRLAAEWDDATAVAHSTSRIALSGPVAELQRIRREWKGVEPPPGLEEFHENIVAFQDETIEGFLAFMAEESEGTVRRHFDSAHTYYMRAFESISDEHLARIGLATPTPIPSPTSTPTPTPRPTSPPTSTPFPPAEIPEGWDVAQCYDPSFTFAHPSDWVEEMQAFGIDLDIPEFGSCIVDVMPFPAFDEFTLSDAGKLNEIALHHINLLGEFEITDKRVEEIGPYKCYIVEGYNIRQDFEGNVRYGPWLEARIPLDDSCVDIHYYKADAGKTIPTADFENLRTLIATIRVQW